MPGESHLRVLVVDDELAIRRFLRTSLQAHGYAVFEAHTGEDAIVEVTAKRPDLVILDLGLPEVDGIEVIKRIRQWSEVPILILSVQDQEQQKIAALDMGADDYLTKPFGIGELMARMRAAIRHRSKSIGDPVFEMPGFLMDFSKRIVKVNDEEISLTPTEYDLLKVLVQDSGKVLTHKQIINTIWGESYEAESHLLRVNISNLRKKIEPDPSRPTFIVTEPGVGYRLRVTV